MKKAVSTVQKAIGLSVLYSLFLAQIYLRRMKELTPKCQPLLLIATTSSLIAIASLLIAQSISA